MESAHPFHQWIPVSQQDSSSGTPDERDGNREGKVITHPHLASQSGTPHTIPLQKLYWIHHLRQKILQTTMQQEPLHLGISTTMKSYYRSRFQPQTTSWSLQRSPDTPEDGTPEISCRQSKSLAPRPGPSLPNPAAWSPPSLLLPLIKAGPDDSIISADSVFVQATHPQSIFAESQRLEPEKPGAGFTKLHIHK